MNCSPLLFLMMNTTLCNIFVFVEGLCLFVNDSITVIINSILVLVIMFQLANIIFFFFCIIVPIFMI